MNDTTPDKIIQIQIKPDGQILALTESGRLFLGKQNAGGASEWVKIPVPKWRKPKPETP